MTPDKTPADRLEEAIETSNLDLALAHSVFRKALESVDDKSGRDLVELMKRRILANDKALHDYRASKVEDDELVERLRLSLENIDNSDVWWIDSPDRGGVDADALEAAITRLQSQSANPWVKIEDIPEAWKDGRAVNLAIRLMGEDDLHIMFACAMNDEVWYDQQGFEILNTVTHAMLPIAPPKTEE